MPQAAWYFLFDFSNYRDSLLKIGVSNDQELQKLLINELGFVGVPGSSFGINPDKLCLRYSYVDLNQDATYPNVVEGVAKLCAYLKSIC